MAGEREIVMYDGLEQPSVEVLIDHIDGGPNGPWCPGELRAWKPVGETAWMAEVQYRPPNDPGSFRIADFPTTHVREDTVDRSRRR